MDQRALDVDEAEIDVEFEMINLEQRIAVTTSWDVWPVTNLIDHNGDMTENPDEALAAVVRAPDGYFIAVDLGEYDFEEDVTWH